MEIGELVFSKKAELIEERAETESGIEVLASRAAPPAEDIADCKRLVAIGAGIKKKEDIPFIQRFADKIGAKLASSRALVEKGWMPQQAQIGLSGRAVQPELLITLGISGSVQFMAGIQGAKKIIAVNTDPEARIFNIAHFAVKEDLYPLLDEIERQWK